MLIRKRPKIYGPHLPMDTLTPALTFEKVIKEVSNTYYAPLMKQIAQKNRENQLADIYERAFDRVYPHESEDIIVVQMDTKVISVKDEQFIENETHYKE